MVLHQDAGRGRQGRTWVSVAGNFYGSTLVEIRDDDPAAQTLSLAAGLALIEAVDVAVPDQRLMLKWPNLYYSTSAFAPKYYPKDIVDYANTRGADRILYAGYFPMGLSLERIMTELPNVPFKDDVWPKFLRENALRVLGLA